MQDWNEKFKKFPRKKDGWIDLEALTPEQYDLWASDPRSIDQGGWKLYNAAVEEHNRRIDCFD